MKIKAEVKNLHTNQTERVFLTEQGETYLVEPYMLESDNFGRVSHRYYPSYTLSKELEGFEYVVYLQEEE